METNKKIKSAVLLINTIFGLILPVAILIAVFSPMIFDSPGSTEKFFTNLLFWSSFTGPIIILMSIITSLVLIYKYESYKRAVLFSLLPLINVVFMMIAAWGIETFQNGRFGG